MKQFYTAFHRTVSETLPGQVAAMEAPRRVIERILAGRMNGFDDTHYFIFQGVKVFEEGKRQEGERKEKLTAEEILFGKKQ